MKISKEGSKVFTESDLIEKIGLNQQDADLILKYQKRLPILIGNENVDARSLWFQLGKPQGDFSHWVKRKIIDKSFEMNCDYSSFDKSVEREIGGSFSKEYLLTIDTAKHVAMMENSDAGKLVRNYFIKVEKALKDYEQWERVRHPEKESYKELCRKLKNKYQQENGREPKFYLYANEADMINIALTGYKAKDLKSKIGFTDFSTREHLEIHINKVFDELQRIDITLIDLGLGFEKRREFLEKKCSLEYLHIKNMLSEFDIAI